MNLELGIVKEKPGSEEQEEEEEEKSRFRHLKEIVIETASESSIHSIPQIFKRKNRVLKVFWALSFMTFAGLSAHMIIKSVSSFYDFETITKAVTVYENPTRFPVVTICNQNAFMTERAFEYVREFVLTNNLTPIDELIVNNFSRIITLMRYGVGVELRNSNTSDEFKKSMGLDIKDMLLSCNYNNQPCSSEDFFWRYDTLYGSCYSFNSGRLANKSGEQIVTKSGSFNGLTLELFVGEPTNLYSLSYTTGAHVIVHNRTVRQPQFYDGLSVSVGTCTNIAVSRVYSSRMQQPYSDCVRNGDLDNRPRDRSLYAATLLNANLTYRQSDCFDVCLQRYVVEYCGCYSIEFEYWNKSQIMPCRNLTELLCYAVLLVEFFSQDVKELCENGCLPECDTVVYPTALSAASYPSAVYGELLKKNSAIRARFNNRTNVTLDELRRNVLSINVYYATMSYQSLSEAAKTSYVDLISNIGGTLGLFLGMSFLSFFEFIDLLLHIAWTLIRAARKTRNNNNNNNKNTSLQTLKF